MEQARRSERDVVLDGSLQHRDGRLRVTARLLDVKDGRQIWAGSFDENVTTIFEVQDTITRRVSEALRAPLSDRMARRRERGSTQNSAAYLAHANGRLAWSRLTEQSLKQAIVEFEKALALDPNYALAHVGIADSYATLGVFGMLRPHDAYPRARTAVQRALEIEPELAAAHATLGHITVQHELDWQAGMADTIAPSRWILPTAHLSLAWHLLWNAWRHCARAGGFRARPAARTVVARAARGHRQHSFLRASLPGGDRGARRNAGVR